MTVVDTAAPDTVEMWMHGEIGWEITSGDFARELAGVTASNITLRVNSPGGSAYDGLAIMESLRGSAATVTAIVEGLAGSAASVIVIGGADRVVMRPSAEIMIHEAALPYADGDADQLRTDSEMLERLSAKVAGIYAARAGGDPEEWRAAMKATTWFTADEAVAAGIADAVEDGRPAEPVNLSKMQPQLRAIYSGERASPPPSLLKHERNSMNLHSELAALLGMPANSTREEVAERLQRAAPLNETVDVTTSVDISYPDDVQVVPTGAVTVTPVGDPVPGLEFSLAASPDGWTAEIDSESGAVTITAPSGVEVGDTGDFAVDVAGSAAPVQLTLTVTVKAAASEEPATPPNTDPGAAPAPLPPAPAGVEPSATVTVPVAHLDWLTAAAQRGGEAQNAAEKAAREAEVDTMIGEGRFSAALRAQALGDFERDAAQARRVWGALPKNAVPRQELGHAASADPTAYAESNSADLSARADRMGLFTIKD